MTASLIHRGPDQQGTHIAARAALGAVRLQVIDLDGGEQPVRDSAAQTALVYNGEIYNFRELREELQRLGHSFRSDCDTEVALRAFLEWDTGCFARFRGMFALAIWQERGNRLVLGRDRAGIKPLYISRQGRDIVFGSELKALFEHPRITRVLDTAALQEYLSLNYVPAPRTLVRGIEKLPSGSFLDWRDGVERAERYWHPDCTPDRSVTEEDAAAELDSLLRASVREHLVSDVPLGVWASGGVDSTALVHYAAEEGAKPLKTFSIAFESKSCDERRWFREVAARYGTEHHEFELTRSCDLETAIHELTRYWDEPGADAGALPVWFLSKMSRGHVTVALSGEGGDELFGGYMTYRADQLARPLRRLPRAVRKSVLASARALLPVSNAKIGFEYKVKRLLEGSLLSEDEAHLFWNGALSQEQKRALLPSLNGHHLRELFEELPGAAAVGNLNRYMMLDQRMYLQDDLLAKVDRMSMAHSLEVRPPLLDHRLIEFAARLPQRFKIRGSRLKWILKRTLRGRIPEAILNRGKSGLDIPAHEWFRGPLLPLLDEMLTPEAIRRTGIFDPAATLALIQNHKEKRINAGYQLWGLLTLFLWMDRWKIEMPPAEEDPAMRRDQFAAAN